MLENFGLKTKVIDTLKVEMNSNNKITLEQVQELCREYKEKEGTK